MKETNDVSKQSVLANMAKLLVFLLAVRSTLNYDRAGTLPKKILHLLIFFFQKIVLVNCEDKSITNLTKGEKVNND